MRMNTRLLSLLAWLVLPGCAAYQLEPLTASHPASLDAASAPVRQPSNTLAYTRADMPSPQPVVQSEGSAHTGHQGQMPDDAGGGTEKTVTGEGKIVASVPASSQLVVDHGEIKGFMGAMTMGYRVEPKSLLEGLKPGDRIRFTIDVPKKAIVKIETMK